MRKKLILFLALILSIFLFTSCSNINQENNNANKKTCSHKYEFITDDICEHNNICLNTPSCAMYHIYFTCSVEAAFDYYIIDSLVYIIPNYEIKMYDVTENEREFSRAKGRIVNYLYESKIDEKYRINWDNVTSFYAAYYRIDSFRGFYDRFIAIFYRSDFNDYAVVVRAH